MFCPRCRTKMAEMKRRYHKHHKWVCPKCGKVRFEYKKSKIKKKIDF